MKNRVLPLAAVSALISAPVASAAPYASAVTVTGDEVTFVLNESADSVKVVFNNGASTLTIGSSPESAGVKTFSKAGFTSFQIEVEKNAGPGWKSGVLQQISEDTSNEVKFANGRGLAVNTYPDSGRFFGRVYISVGANGTAAGRTLTEGVYVLNADLKATALGDVSLNGTPVRPPVNVGDPVPTITNSSTNSPYRLTVGEKGDLFIVDWSDANGSVYKTNGDVSDLMNLLPGPVGSAFPIGDSKRHGSIAGVAVSGSEADNNLKIWTVDEDMQSSKTSTTMAELNSVWAWDSAGDGLPFVNDPIQVNKDGVGIAANPADIARGADGYMYKMIQRAGGDTRNIFALAQDGVRISDSRSAWRAYTGHSNALDPFLESIACDISSDGWLVVLRNRDNALHVVKMNEGNFDFSSYILLYPTPTTNAARDVCFDAAGNIYSLSSGQALLRVYSRGGHTKAVTTSSGTFSIEELTPTPPAPVLNPLPELTNFAADGPDLTMTMVSRVNFIETHVIESSPDLGETTPWSVLVNAVTPFTLTGSPPNYTIRIPGALAAPESRLFYRVRRN